MRKTAQMPHTCRQLTLAQRVILYDLLSSTALHVGRMARILGRCLDVILDQTQRNRSDKVAVTRAGQLKKF